MRYASHASVKACTSKNWPGVLSPKVDPDLRFDRSFLAKIHQHQEIKKSAAATSTATDDIAVLVSPFYQDTSKRIKVSSKPHLISRHCRMVILTIGFQSRIAKLPFTLTGLRGFHTRAETHGIHDFRHRLYTGT